MRPTSEWPPRLEQIVDKSITELIVSAYLHRILRRHDTLGGTEMPFIATIIARSLALHDWYLAQFVDVSVTNTSTSCYVAYQIDANVNACGQTYLTLLMDIREALMALMPALLSGLFAY